jgi:hypothetical protein
LKSWRGSDQDRHIPSLLLFLLVLAAISAAYLSGVAAVPFHPDESTQLFTSGDVELLLKQPADLFWRAESENDLRQRYRELDAPFTHYLIAGGRWLAGLPALPVDWDWSKTWQENQQAGALPSPELLLAGRFAVAALFPFSVLFLFLATRRVTNEFTAWTAALLLASNTLVLLHTRRAMAEGGLVFTVTLTMWVLVKARKRPWLAAIPAALAFCAKQSLLALAPVGILAVLWPLAQEPVKLTRNRSIRLFSQSLLFGAIFIVIVVSLNPFLWAEPVPAFQAAMRSRQALASAQVGDRTEQALNTPGRRIISLVGSLYLTPPMIAETSNYLANTRAAETAYLANPLHTLFRTIPGGGLLLMIGLSGFILCGLRVVKPGEPARHGLILLLAATLLQSLALLVLIPLPWQRYYLPVVPFACLWTAYGANPIKELVFRAIVTRSTSSLKKTSLKPPV